MPARLFKCSRPLVLANAAVCDSKMRHMKEASVRDRRTRAARSRGETRPDSGFSRTDEEDLWRRTAEVTGAELIRWDRWTQGEVLGVR